MNTKSYTQEELVALQVEIEKDMRGLGIERYRSEVAKAQEHEAETRTSYGKLLLARGIEPVAKGIQDWIDDSTGRVGRAHVALKYLRKMDPNVAALLALRTVLSSITRSKVMLQHTACTVGMVIDQELRMAAFEEQDAANFNRMLKKTKKSHHAGYKGKVMSVAATRSQVEYEKMPMADKLLVGQRLIEIISETTGWVEIKQYSEACRRREGKGEVVSKRNVMTATAKIMEWIEAHQGRAELLRPFHLPMVVEPKDWTSPFDGGYITDTIPRMPLVKSKKAAYLEELANRADSMQGVYRAINGLQRTGWKINPKTYAVAQELWGRGGGVAKLPAQEDTILPPHPAGLDLDSRETWTEQDQETWKSWKAKAAKVHKDNIKLRGKRLHTMKALWIAGKYADIPAFYFPYQLDFRGRAYTMAAYLSPQGNDLSKGLLLFANGKPIGTKEAADWLAIHGANVYGYDKVSLEERVAWVKEHEDQIKATAADPLANLDFWGTLKKPWQFLAWCFEWAGYLDQGLDYVSSLPIAMDGSCNGIQIFSLVLRDKVGGEAVNLLPSDKPQDIYQRVADKVIEVLTSLPKDHEDYELAQQWLGFGINRDTTKRSVMILPYGGRTYSMREYVGDYIEECEKDHPWGDSTWKPQVWLTKHIWDAIGEVVVSARECMGWLQKMAAVAAKRDLPIIWTTPDGFIIQQAYEEIESRRVKAKLGEGVVRLEVNESIANTVDRRRQSSGVAPNWVHSLDGCALRTTINYALDKGIDQFAMIHDSYGTVAADTPALAKELRQAFVDIFTGHDVLADFQRDVRKLVGEGVKLPPIPAKGTLEVSKVLESAFFFA